MKSESTQVETRETSSRPYITGFLLALILTLVAYLAVINHWLSGSGLIVAIVILALLQLVVQLVFFLHFGKDKNRIWHSAAFYFMILILLVIVGGSLWIMQNLNYHMQMTPEQMNEYMLKENKKGF